MYVSYRRMDRTMVLGSGLNRPDDRIARAGFALSPADRIARAVFALSGKIAGEKSGIRSLHFPSPVVGQDAAARSKVGP